MEYPFVIEIKKKTPPFLAWSAGLKIYKAVPLSSANRETFRNVYLVYLFFSLALNMIHKISRCRIILVRPSEQQQMATLWVLLACLTMS